MLYHRFRAMNTSILLAAESRYPLQIFEIAQQYIEQSEERFTRFKETSELSALNRSAGEWFDVSPDMLDLLITALACHYATNGIFDPAILPDLKTAGYTQSFDQLREHGVDPTSDQMTHSKRQPFSAIELDSLHGRVRLPEGMQIDLGGIAKGWIVEKAARHMAKHCTACAVNAGGDMFLIGKPQGQTSWEVALEDPRDPIQDLMVLEVEEGAVATSSVVKRSWQQGEKKRHHLIDPRTGEPAETPWLSVTVFAPQAVQAETFAKSILIAGPNQAQALVDNNPGISFLAVDEQGQIVYESTEKAVEYAYA